jgi:tight adherence protein B
MTRKLILVGLALLSALAVVPAGTAAGEAPSLSQAGNTRFPDRSYVLTLPEHARLADGDVHVTENGGSVRSLQVTPLGASKRSRLGVVLSVDTSASMRGAPLDGAFAAARGFSRARNERQPLALVTFGSRSQVAMPFTTDAFRIRRELARPVSAAGGTHLYDAGLRGIELIRRAGLPGGFLVLLTDGTDHGSTTSANALSAAARKAHVRIYSVGLRSSHFDSVAPRRLAESTGGAYSEASSPDDLARIFSALGAELSNGYMVHYRSLAGPEEPVDVRVSVEGFATASASYTSPRLQTTPPGQAGDGGRWSSTLSTVLAAGVVAGLLGLSLFALLWRRRSTPRERVAWFVASQPEADPSRSLTGRLTTGAEQRLSRAAWWDDFVTELEIAEIRWLPAQVVLGAAAGGLGGAILLAVATGTPLVAIVPVLLTPFAVRLVVSARADGQRRRFEQQLADHLSVVGGAMRAGHGLPAAFSSVLDDAPQPSRREFGRVVADERLGAPLEDALESLARRMRNRDVEQVALLARLHRESGADAAEMLDRVVETVREREQLRGTVRTLTAQGRLSRWILSALPVVVLIGMTLTSGKYVEPLYDTGIGNVLLAVAALMVVSGSLVIKRIVNFKI